MTERDPDAWWSPVPGSPEPGPVAMSGSTPWAPPAGQDWAHPAVLAAASAPPSPRRHGRLAWVVAGAATLVLVTCALVAHLVLAPATKPLMDSAGTVSIAVPRSWYNNTDDPSSSPDDAPVLSASNLWQTRWLRVDAYAPEAGDTLSTFHADGIEHECASWSCSSRGGARPIRVSDRDALEQVVTHPADADGGASTSLTLTVWDDDEVVELYAVATAGGDTAPSPKPLERIASSLRLTS